MSVYENIRIRGVCFVVRLDFDVYVISGGIRNNHVSPRRAVYARVSRLYEKNFYSEPVVTYNVHHNNERRIALHFFHVRVGPATVMKRLGFIGKRNGNPAAAVLHGNGDFHVVYLDFFTVRCAARVADGRKFKIFSAVINQSSVRSGPAVQSHALGNSFLNIGEIYGDFVSVRPGKLYKIDVYFVSQIFDLFQIFDAAHIGGKFFEFRHVRLDDAFSCGFRGCQNAFVKRYSRVEFFFIRPAYFANRIDIFLFYLRGIRQRFVKCGIRNGIV